MTVQLKLPDVLTYLHGYSTGQEPLYVVGGVVRDALLSRNNNDIDIVSCGNPRMIGRRFADEQRGAFYVLDDERDTCRVLIERSQGGRLVFDFSRLQGGSIEEDLQQRDFTINAMAVSLNDLEVIIDPLKGGRDLQQKWLRPVNRFSLENDPLRVIRAIRYAVCLGLRIEPETANLIERAAGGLRCISAERKRDELFKIFSNERTSTALQLLNRFRIFENIPLPIREDFPFLVRYNLMLGEVIGWITGAIPVEKQASLHQVSLLLQLSRFKDRLRALLRTENSSSRNRLALLHLATILDETAAALPGTLVKTLALSVEEENYVRGFIRHRNLAGMVLNNPFPLPPLALYRYFKATNSVGVDLLIAALAKYSTRIGSEFSQDTWLNLLNNSAALMSAWFERPEIVRPVPILNGEKLMKQFNLEPGPMIGYLLEGLKEEQVGGNVKNQEEAINWVENQIRRS